MLSRFGNAEEVGANSFCGITKAEGIIHVEPSITLLKTAEYGIWVRINIVVALEPAPVPLTRTAITLRTD
jgi:hypothetical protein